MSLFVGSCYHFKGQKNKVNFIAMRDYARTINPQTSFHVTFLQTSEYLQHDLKGFQAIENSN